MPCSGFPHYHPPLSGRAGSCLSKLLACFLLPPLQVRSLPGPSPISVFWNTWSSPHQDSGRGYIFSPWKHLMGLKRRAIIGPGQKNRALQDP